MAPPRQFSPEVRHQRDLASKTRYRRKNAERLREENRLRAQARRAADPVKARQVERQWASANREKRRAAVRKWRAAHPEADREVCVRWRAANPEKSRAATRRWVATHPDEARAGCQRRRARLRGAPVRTLTAAQWREVLVYFNHTCAYCLRTGLKLTVDHVVPLCRGGTHEQENVVPACETCNPRKGGRGILLMLRWQPVAFEQQRKGGMTMGWFLTGRGRAEAKRSEDEFAQALHGAKEVGIDGLRARLQAIRAEVHVREAAIPSVPEMKPVDPQAVSTVPSMRIPDARRPQVPRPGPPVPLVVVATRPGPRPPPLPREEPIDTGWDEGAGVATRTKLPSSPGR